MNSRILLLLRSHNHVTNNRENTIDQVLNNSVVLMPDNNVSFILCDVSFTVCDVIMFHLYYVM